MIMSPEQFYSKYCNSGKVALINRGRQQMVLFPAELWKGFYIYNRYATIGNERKYYYDAFKDRLNSELCICKLKRKFFSGKYELILKGRQEYLEDTLEEDLTALITYMDAISSLRDRVCSQISKNKTFLGVWERVQGLESLLNSMDQGPIFTEPNRIKQYFMKRYTAVMMKGKFSR